MKNKEIGGGGGFYIIYILRGEEREKTRIIAMSKRKKVDEKITVFFEYLTAIFLYFLS